jgi:hypothetical protein
MAAEDKVSRDGKFAYIPKSQRLDSIYPVPGPYSQYPPPPRGAFLCSHIFQRVKPKIFIWLNLAIKRSYQMGYRRVSDDIPQNIPNKRVSCKIFSVKGLGEDLAALAP